MKGIKSDIEFTMPSIGAMIILLGTIFAACFSKDTSQLMVGFGLGAGLLGAESKLQNDFYKNHPKELKED